MLRGHFWLLVAVAWLGLNGLAVLFLGLLWVRDWLWARWARRRYATQA